MKTGIWLGGNQNLEFRLWRGAS